MHRFVSHGLVATVLASMVLPAIAGSVAPTEPAQSVASPADARSWLQRIHAAAKLQNYQGTMVFSAGGTLSSSRVAHYCVGKQSFERLEALDGRQQRIYRLDDAVHTLWPQAKLAVFEKRAPVSGLPSATQAIEPRALQQYGLQLEGSERIAGREAQVFLLKPRDDLRYAQRLWADKATGLMLRTDVISARGKVLESTAFSEVEIGIKAAPQTVTQPLKQLSGYRVVQQVQQPTRLAAEGWALAHPVPGFSLAGCVKRPLEAAGGEAQVLQAVFSDGLTHVSLFIEPYDARRAYADGGGLIGAMATLRERQGDYWITVVGDVPAATLKVFADALQRRP